MTRTAVIVAVVSALCIGSAIGFAGGVLFSHHALGMGFRYEPREFHDRRGGPPGEPSPRMLVPRLVHMLDLTPQQADSIRDEIEASRADFAQVRDSLHARIERHLTPAQRDRWRETMKERRSGDPRGHDPHFRAEPGREGEQSR